MSRVMLGATGLAAGETVLDLGCGPGIYFPYLWTTVGESGLVVGIADRAGMLTRARARRADADWPNVVAKVEDAITADFGTAHDATIARVSTALRRGGRLGVSHGRRALAAAHDGGLPPRVSAGRRASRAGDGRSACPVVPTPPAGR